MIMDDFISLCLLSLAMLVGCYLAGIIPIAISFSEEKMKMITVLGAGLLVGTALAVIIPEGIHAMGETAAEQPIKSPHKLTDTPVKPETDHPHDHHDHEHEHHHSVSDYHNLIGVTLVAGFIFMLLVDQLGGSHMHAPIDAENASTDAQIQQNRHRVTATLGLVVHAAADGVAMGAAVMMQRSHLTLIVFVAIMLHKAPAAFGLVSFLRHNGFDKPRIKRHLFVFALAAPVMAIVTYICLFISQHSLGKISDNKTTGIAMLFSAGTFLYVATVHVLPEIQSSQSKTVNSSGAVIIHEHKGFKKVELLALVVGSVLPVILSLGHKH